MLHALCRLHVLSICVLLSMLLASCGFPTRTSGPPDPQPFAQWAQRPPMGWNSYDSYHGCITEDQFKDVVDWWAEQMLPLGYDYVVIDFLWFHPGPDGWNPDKDHWTRFKMSQKPDENGNLTPTFAMDAYGRLLPAPNRFPSSVDGRGFKPLADYVHSKGLKFGIHIMRGIPHNAVEQDLPVLGSSQSARDIAEDYDVSSFLRGMFNGLDHEQPGAQTYYDSIFALYASWDVDFIKADDMMVPNYHAAEIEMMRRAIDKCGRPMVLSLSYGMAPVSRAYHLWDNANMWRVSKDFWDRWHDLKDMFNLMDSWTPFIGQGTWPDADMIPFGMLKLQGPGRQGGYIDKFSDAERRALMSLWCISRSPLMWGGDPLTTPAHNLSFLTNPEVLAVNKNSVNNRQIWNRSESRIWMADIPGSPDKYFAMFNLKDNKQTVRFDLDLEYLRGRYRIRDLWARKDLGVFEKEFKLELEPHEGRLYRLMPE